MIKESDEKVADTINEIKRELASKDKKILEQVAAPQSKFQPVRPQESKYKAKPTTNGYTTADTKPSELETMTAAELMQGDFGELRFMVKGLIHQGLAILAAPPKFGKSWMAFDMCICVAFGEPFLGHETTKGDSLYLALEDSNRRLKDRLSKLLNGRKPPDNLHLAIKAGTLDGELSVQVEEHLKKHPNTTLIVVDILQRIRSTKVSRAGKNAYELDTDDLAKLKAIADKHNICIFTLHHPRKFKDTSDPFNNFSGSTGIQGAVDEMFILDKENRDDVEAKLIMASREMDGKELILRFNRNTCKWELVGTAEDEQKKREIEEYSKDPVVVTIKAMLKASPSGLTTRASEFAIAMIHHAGTTISESEVGKRFKKYAYPLYVHDKIKYEPPQYSKQRIHTFKYINKYQISFLSDTPDTADTAATPDTPDTKIV